MPMIEHPHVRQLSAAFRVEGRYYVFDDDEEPMEVNELWRLHRAGESAEALVLRYPKLGVARVFDALAFCYDNPGLV